MRLLNPLPPQFMKGYRAIMLMHRDKDGGEVQEHKVIQKISSNAQDFDEIVTQFQHMQDGGYASYRIYASVNSRCPKKVIREFKRRQLDHEYECVDKAFEFYLDVKNRMFSCFMNPKSANESYFLLDCDSGEDYDYVKGFVDEQLVMFDYPTRNGHHFITKPFNPTGFQVEIKRDALMYIG